MKHGLWWEYMYDELLWSADAHGRLSNDTPSWSWLSLEGRISKLYSVALNKEKTATIHVEDDAFTSNLRSIKATAPMSKIESVSAALHRYKVVEDDKLKLKLNWNSDIPMQQRVFAWALQFQTDVQGTKRRCRSYRGLVIVSVDEAKTGWSRVGYYDFHIWGLKSWQYGKNWDKMTTITLVWIPLPITSPGKFFAISASVVRGKSWCELQHCLLFCPYINTLR
ncbi:hypothetical protein EK21DRAFT_110257 [Setomelanomma holmii]|uniref:Uncharacterized protein n=1 Tax=Setomelanomma holmii TaxID=210430 RepID=A0A9P4LNH3_9PLEO|nr:hypothetical protein EK21DRAFT_110257 [Setomelanomma holmii]